MSPIGIDPPFLPPFTSMTYGWCMKHGQYQTQGLGCPYCPVQPDPIPVVVTIPGAPTREEFAALAARVEALEKRDPNAVAASTKPAAARRKRRRKAS